MAKRTKKVFYVLLGLAILLLIITEVSLRTVYGFTQAVLVREDKSFEYIPIPQDRMRFGKKNYYNSFSQRNREIASDDSIVVLGFGDSVLNGGSLTDQDSLATTLLTNYLSKKLKKKTIFTNISAGSWGPDNCYAYLKNNGDFNANSIFLAVSSHDAYDNMNFEKIVGARPDFPDEQYSLAVVEVVDRYLYPRYLKHYFEQNPAPASESNDLMINKYKAGAKFNSGFSKFKSYADSVQVPLLIYLHADKEEMNSGEYNKQGQEIINFCKSNKIELIKELDYKLNDEDYRDGIHLSEAGQRRMFNIIKEYY